MSLRWTMDAAVLQGSAMMKQLAVTVHHQLSPARVEVVLAR
ncbi:hypothetical protein [Rhizobium sp. R635]|nr:hypothetical protein [Rhizobium sp. R635]